MSGKKRALFIGRFQPFHNGHYKAIKKLLAEYEEVVIVLGSAESPISFENPFSAGERIEMIRACIGKAERSRILLIPVRDINDHSRWVEHVSSYVPSYECVYSNNEIVNELFGARKIPVKKMGFFDRERYEGRKIRALIIEGKPLDGYVPKNVIKYIEKYNAAKRLGRTTN